MEPPTLILPFVYDINSNLTQIAEKRDTPLIHVATASMHLKRFAEYGISHNECSIFPAVRDILANLMIGSEPPQIISSPAHTGSVTPTMQPSPAMMHSPISGGVQGPGPMNPQAGGVIGPHGGNPNMGGLPNPGMPGNNPQVPVGLGQGGPVVSGAGPYPGMGLGQHNMMGPN